MRYLRSHLGDPMRFVLPLLFMVGGSPQGCCIVLGCIVLLLWSVLGLRLRMHCRSWCRIFLSMVFCYILEADVLGFLPLFYRICIWCLCVGSCGWLLLVSFCFWVLRWHCLVFCLAYSCVLVVCLHWYLLFLVPILSPWTSLGLHFRLSFLYALLFWSPVLFLG